LHRRIVHEKKKEKTRINKHICQLMVFSIISYLIGKYLTRVSRRINHAATEKSDNEALNWMGHGAKSNSERFSQGHSPSLPFPCRRNRLL